MGDMLGPIGAIKEPQVVLPERVAVPSFLHCMFF